MAEAGVERIHQSRRVAASPAMGQLWRRGEGAADRKERQSAVANSRMALFSVDVLAVQ
jgi:hypothetical protein